MKEEVDGNIDLSPQQFDDQNGVADRNSYSVIDSEGENNGEFENSLEKPASASVYEPPAETAPPLRRSARTCKPPGSYGLNLLSQALVAQEVPDSF